MRTTTYLSLLTGVAFAIAFAPPAQAGFQWTAPNGGLAANGAIATGTALPHVAAVPVAPVTTDDLSNDMTGSAPVSANAIPTMPDGPVSGAPIYGQGPQGPMTNDPITWNAPHSAGTNVAAAAPRAPQSVLPAETQPLVPAPMAQMAPVISQTTYTAPAPMPVAPVMETTSAAAPGPAPVTAEPTMIAASTSVTTPAGAMSTAGASGTFDVAEGFGSDLPLVMAIRQVVPASYGFVFDDGINLATNVSWKGGKPWNVVLSDMLTPLGLRASINGKVVSILPANAGITQVAMAGPAVTTTQTTTVTTGGNAMAPMVTPISSATAPAIYMGNPVVTPASHSVDLDATSTWTAARNSTLRNILESWSQRAGVELYWASEYDYPVQSAVSISGTFEEAVQTLLKGLNESRPRPLGRLHPNLPNGPAVLVIETREGSM